MMELVRGQSLLSFIRKSPAKKLEEGETKKIFA